MNPQDAPQDDAPKVTLYDRYGRPVQVDPSQIAQPANYPANEKQVQATSHVTKASEYAEGANFDPQIRAQYANEPRVAHATRPVEPLSFPISDELRSLHEESQKKYPTINLSEGEHILMDVRRHPIGLLAPILVSGGLIVAFLALLFSLPVINENMTEIIIDPSLAVAIIIPLILLVGIFGYIAVWVYLQNRLLLTNESVIQEIQHTLFSKHEQTVSLGSVEDASYVQRGVLQAMFNYGTVRLSTEGEETTYRFQFVANPKQQVAALTNAVEAFKNGRPVTPEIID
jgi:hypothetical protein